ncbi:MAG: hypothetical protein QFB87_04475 [Patescibacteria group bacterium]|nr:hypothetical protein [Patescibacteria group bacterium]
MNEVANDVLAQVSDEVAKAAVVQSTYTFAPPTRSIFSPENLDPIIKLLVPTTAPIRAALPRTTGMGQAAGWQVLTSKLDNSVSGTNSVISFADAGQPLQTTQTYAFKSAAYKNLGRDVEVGRQQIAANKGGKLEDIRAKLELIKTKEVILGEENTILNGSVAGQATDFDGLNVQLTSNTSGMGGGYMTASGVGNFANTLFVAGSESPTHWIASSVQNQALSNALAGTGSIQRISMDDQGRAVGGQRLAKIVNPVTGSLIEVITSRFAGGQAYLLTISGEAGENWVEMEDLEPLSVYDVPTANHSMVSRVYETCVLKVIGEVFQYKVTGLALS